jgi:hypothetical protein
VAAQRGHLVQRPYGSAPSASSSPSTPLSIHPSVRLHWGGEANAMSENCSRLWHLSDSQLLAHFACHYPQSRPWMLYHLRKPMCCALISALSTNASGPELRNNAPMQWKSIGRPGTHSAWPTMSTPTFTPGKTQSLCSKSSANGIATEGCPPATSPSTLEQWRTASAQWARRTPDWRPRTRARIHMGAYNFGSSGK